MHYYGLTPSYDTVKLHKEFSSTSCPHRSSDLHGQTIEAVRNYFISKIKHYMSLGKTVKEMIDKENGGTVQPAPVKPITRTEAKADGNVVWEKWTGTVKVDTLNVRNKPSTDGAPIAQYHNGDKINFDGWCIVNGYRWGTYISYSGVRRYVAYRDESDGTYFMSY